MKKTIISTLIFCLLLPVIGNTESANGSDSINNTGWGDYIDGLRLQVSYKKEVFYLDSISLKISLLINRSEVPALQPLPEESLTRSFIALRLICIDNGSSCKLKNTPFDLWTELSDQGSISDISTDSIVTFSTQFNNVGRKIKHKIRPKGDISCHNCNDTAIYQVIAIGDYITQVELFMPETDSGNWHGLLLSPQFDLHITGSEDFVDKQSFTFPNRLKLSQGPMITFDENDMDTSTYNIREDAYRSFSLSGGIGEVIAYCPPKFPDIYLNNGLTSTNTNECIINAFMQDKVIFENGRYTFKLSASFFESSNYINSSCGRGYRGFWRRSLFLDIEKSAYDSLFIPLSEIYDFSTAIVPARININNGQLSFDGMDSIGYRELRAPKGSRLFTELRFDSTKDITINGLYNFYEDMYLDNDSNLFPQVIFISIFTEDSTKKTNTLWEGEYVNSNQSPEYILQNENYSKYPEALDFIQIFMPSGIKINEALEISADYSDSIILEFYKKPDAIILANIGGDGDRSKMVSTSLDGVIFTPVTPHVLNGSMYRFTIELYSIPYDENHVQRRMGTKIWEKDYDLKLSKKTAKKMQKMDDKNRRKFRPMRFY